MQFIHHTLREATILHYFIITHLQQNIHLSW